MPARVECGAQTARVFSGCDGPCSAGYYCPAGSTSPAQVLCPAGSFCPAGAGAATPCAGGTFSDLPGAALCQPCPAGSYCAPGTARAFGAPCGVGNYCPAGSASPLPCPTFGMVDATRGPANGPAFDVDTAACYNHCVLVLAPPPRRFT